MYKVQYFKTVMFFILVLQLIACDKPELNLKVHTLKLLAGSELKDITPMLTLIQQNTGVLLQVENIGTIDGAEKIVNEPENYDVAWFSNVKYLNLLQAEKKIILAQECIAISPVILGVKQSLAKAWGWDQNSDISWNDIAEKVKSGELNFAMTDPTASNSGFATVMSVQAAFSHKKEVITAMDVDAEKLKIFFNGHSLTAGSSGFLSESFLVNQQRLAGIFNYESELLKLNNNPLLAEKLTLIYPKEGTVISDYPFILLAKDKIEDYLKVIAYLKSADFQSWMMVNTDRRPVNSEVLLGNNFNVVNLKNIPFPNSIDTVNEILFSYLNDTRKPSHSYFVLDLSGSMRGKRLDDLKQAMNNLSGDDSSITGRFASFREREIITIITFNHDVIDTQDFYFGHDKTPVIDTMKNYITGLNSFGGTAIYGALKKAYIQAKHEMKLDPNRFYSVVLMTDGINESGINFDDFQQFFKENLDSNNSIQTFPILFGEAKSEELQQLASITGGKLFDSRKSSLSHVFKQIKGYQ